MLPPSPPSPYSPTMPLSSSSDSKWQRLAILNHHVRDERIQFEESSHTYTIDGVKKGWKSCTGFLHDFFEPFNADEVITKMMRSRKWGADNKYFGMTPDAIKAQWAEKGRIASEAGTRMHLDIEHAYNAMAVGRVEAKSESESESESECWTLASGLEGLALDGWAPHPSPEWDYFQAFQREHVERYGLIPFRTEWLVFDEETKIAGSIDMVFYKPDGTLAIYDWKRTEELKMHNDYQKGLSPVEHLPDTNYWHYSLQLNVYRYILQKHYGVTVSELALVVLHPNNTSWKVARLNLMDSEVADMMDTRG